MQVMDFVLRYSRDGVSAAWSSSMVLKWEKKSLYRILTSDLALVSPTHSLASYWYFLPLASYWRFVEDGTVVRLDNHNCLLFESLTD